MGNDGGSIPKRIELVKEKQKNSRCRLYTRKLIQGCNIRISIEQKCDVKMLNLTPNPPFKKSSASVAHFRTGNEVPSEACIQNNDGHDNSPQSSKKLAIDSQINGSISSAPSKAR
ncbi:2082_t:CDS:2, partial [Gigaspora margarita]